MTHITPSPYDLRTRIVGIDERVPLLDGSLATYVNLDNAASTPALTDVLDAVDRFMPYYSSVHRGTGFKSRLSTLAYDQAHEIIAEFVGANPHTNTVIFGKNTTEAINKLSFRLPAKPGSVVITTQLEHHSNDLPWRARFPVEHVRALPDGRLDEDDFDRLLAQHAGNIALVTVTGASNVSGFLQPIHRLARKAHAAGAQILVDAAQLAPHRQVDMKPDGDPEHLDFVTISAHKMYAPFGTGALIGPKAIFMQGAPEYPGGGTVDVVTLDEVHWAGMPDRDEAGSPNVVGAVAMAAAAKALMAIGMDQVAAHEQELLAYATERLLAIPGVTIYGESNPARLHEKVGVIPFNLAGVSHFKLAAILGYEGGIGVRSGCFCAHPYVVHLLNLDDEAASTWRTQLLEGDKSNMPGMVRMSFGCYNNRDDVNRLLAMLERIARNDYAGDYRLDRQTGEYRPADFTEPIASYFTL
ncbi:MAG: aminotransferase class V-fold PLP-dependent enzyme [Anaerolineales bacterium]|nr:aminotransferase class V-fold PLP-dependent enzyme [Anaerolineales bacterium]MCO5242417.1 aminotransferase class V-fold PLP-dependent enzyme [Anaerolineae bacterium]